MGAVVQNKVPPFVDHTVGYVVCDRTRSSTGRSLRRVCNVCVTMST